MKRRKLSPSSRENLEFLPTKRLLARLKRLHQCEESIALSDKEIEWTDPNFIEFKESPQWILEYEHLKEILSKREHISSKK